MGIKIRKANVDDAYGITKVNVYTWYSTYQWLMPLKVLQTRIEFMDERADKLRETLKENDKFLVAEDEESNEIIWMLSYWESRNEQYKESWEIYAFYVLKDYQKQKIWKWLFVEAVNQLINLWYTSMIINVLVWNPAINFYKKYGWVEVWEKTDPCGKIMITEKIMYYENLKKIIENN